MKRGKRSERRARRRLNVISGRPQSRDAEMSVLGAMLFEEDAFIRAIEILRPEYFYYEA
ncbi:MAG: replicative DNA helicase, partial [Deltaproteobacteria bacterium]|nr:replicative DNA helicase [Deltaproteobacteria bacterium]